MRFKTEKEIYFSILHDNSEDTKLSAAAAADKYKDKLFFLISNSSSIIEDNIDYINSNFNLRCNIVLLDQKWLLDIVPFFIHDMFNNKQKIIQVLLENNLETKDIFPSGDLINIAIGKTISGESLDENTIENPIIRDQISRIVRTLIVVQRSIIKYYIGESVFNPSINISNRAKTDFNGLKLQEYITSLQNIQKLGNTGLPKLDEYINNKLITLKRYLPIIPNTPNDIIDKTRPSNSLHDGFPTIYKLLSCLQYKSALLSMEYNNPNSAFLHSIRTIETYIEGFLIYANVATISDYYNRRGVLSEKDAFMINNNKLSGFGKKYASAGDVNNLKNHKFYVKIREMIDLRNKLYLTHGDMKACSLLTKQSLYYIIDFINYIDNISNQRSLPWKKIYRDIDKSVKFDFYGVTKSSLSHIFIHKYIFQLNSPQ
ncbi:hypothetical protein E4A08_08345 [Salmonella enterica subsp. enterica serovar Hull]|nr:hypothetical protein [Salmonella enterica subsp. enterica serovar Hull]